MAVEVFLGEPPEYVDGWVVNGNGGPFWSAPQTRIIYTPESGLPSTLVGLQGEIDYEQLTANIQNIGDVQEINIGTDVTRFTGGFDYYFSNLRVFTAPASTVSNSSGRVFNGSLLDSFRTTPGQATTIPFEFFYGSGVLSVDVAEGSGFGQRAFEGVPTDYREIHLPNQTMSDMKAVVQSGAFGDAGQSNTYLFTCSDGWLSAYSSDEEPLEWKFAEDF